MCARVLPQYHRYSEGGVKCYDYGGCEVVDGVRNVGKLLAPFLSTLSELGV